jgi:predicted Rdx family selenoprotein
MYSLRHPMRWILRHSLLLFFPFLGVSQSSSAIDVAGFIELLGKVISYGYTNACLTVCRTSTELMLTFPPPSISSISLIPLDSEDTGGRFRVWLYLSDNEGSTPVPTLIWDRKIEGGFPEMKVLVRLSSSRVRSSNLTRVAVLSSQKQRIRDHIDPGKSLGHSDKHTSH